MLPSKSEKLKIVVVDDHPMFREGVVRLIEAEAGMVVVATGGTALEAVQLAALHEPDVMLLDVHMAGGGVAAARTIQQSRPGVRILMLSMSDDQDLMMLSLKHGAVGYLLKGIGGPALVDAIRLATSDLGGIDSAEARALLADEHAHHPQHSPRGRQRSHGCRALTELETGWLTRTEAGQAPSVIARELGLDARAAASVVSAILINKRIARAGAPAQQSPVALPPANPSVTRH